MTSLSLNDVELRYPRALVADLVEQLTKRYEQVMNSAITICWSEHDLAKETIPKAETS
jgi:hypothetical protein